MKERHYCDGPGGSRGRELMDQFIMVDTGSKRKKGESVAESQGSRRAWRKLQRRDPCMDEEPPHGGATGGGVGRGGRCC